MSWRMEGTSLRFGWRGDEREDVDDAAWLFDG